MLSLTYPIALASLAASALADIHNVNLPSNFFDTPQSGIGSWYRASAGQDSTNGKSWCAYTYYNSDPIFAVSLKAMGGKTYNSDPAGWKAATQKYCGLEATVKDPKTGKQMLMYIGDAFDDRYVHSTGSIDIMIDAFSNIHGNPNGNKNEVIKGVEWQLTGRVNTKYAAAGAVWPTKAGAAPTTAAPKPSSSTPNGGEGAKCSNATNCKSGMTCLAPDGVCSTAACNWGCTGWTCSAASPCQKPNTCVQSVCMAT
ncbi:uncharacterized protein M421DRAFT_420999 [Didymella exigua CBS 183.55]|uniref:Carbohydrate-binding module family 18 protein n=1 Tax=Didymella exigua CBS 183.55 TaxID=1150837 RepID=A0A6A5RSH6_9PLEO|nr:uncharacterized protein M421DRAFT_420999 [Didymella exigua CBS 183.55]KAF1928457.1 hypothetical protein M421DRAFT_420999 [Didymella exigua CBS 183.55]